MDARRSLYEKLLFVRAEPFLSFPYVSLKPQFLVTIHGTNVSGRLRYFRLSTELKAKNMSEMVQFLHLALHFLAPTAPLTIFKWQNFNMQTQAQQLNVKYKIIIDK